MYGSRGASGVIEIKTKKGTGRGFEISYDGNYGFESMYKHLQMLNGPEYIATAKALGLDYNNGGYNTKSLLFIYDQHSKILKFHIFRQNSVGSDQNIHQTFF